MDHKALDIGYIGKKRENIQIINKLPCFFLAALDIKGKDRSAAVREILFIKRMVRVIYEGGMVHLFYLRVICQEFHNLLCVFSMPFKPEGQGFHALQKKECIKRGNGGSRVAEQDRADVSNKGSRSYHIIERYAMIAGIRCGNVRILAGSCPVELS